MAILLKSCHQQHASNIRNGVDLPYAHDRLHFVSPTGYLFYCDVKMIACGSILLWVLYQEQQRPQPIIAAIPTVAETTVTSKKKRTFDAPATEERLSSFCASAGQPSLPPPPKRLVQVDTGLRTHKPWSKSIVSGYCDKRMVQCLMLFIFPPSFSERPSSHCWHQKNSPPRPNREEMAYKDARDTARSLE